MNDSIGISGGAIIGVCAAIILASSTLLVVAYAKLIVFLWGWL